MISYQDTVDYLFTQLPVFQNIGAGAYKPGLATAHTLSEAFDNPHESFRSLHIAGTNGKGSTSHNLASVLMAAGYRVGLFTSPHLFDFRERIRVNGKMIPEEYVVDFVERYKSMDLGLSPSFFELTTIMAFDYFRSECVDIAVVEVGLGGRLDTTNIITPELAIITNVSLDHMAQLGDTEVQIAAEKAGIIKPGVPVVIGEAEGEVREVFQRKADSLGSPIVFAEDTPVDFTMKDGHFVYSLRPGDVPSIESDLTGSYQPANMNTVIHALRLLPGIPDSAVAEGMADVQRRTGLMGRWMELPSDGPKVICDTGHNIGAWRHLASHLTSIAEHSILRMVIGFVSDKDVTPIFEILPRNARYYLVSPSVKRGRPAYDLLSYAVERGLNARAFGSVSEGYECALAESSISDTIFIGGSNYVIADLGIYGSKPVM
ncbi:MAG: bifunctional folylpolyglutamate synthase/dihydrofolate synthase [Muribaculaceae bacterium]|nr:bifunctional folylpolyglutamate synthase/dihydrofolate synthase [Muribaculaceae bacterium]